MRTGHVSIAALASVAAWALTILPASSQGVTPSETPAAGTEAALPAPIGLNWPPKSPFAETLASPAAAAPEAAPAATAITVEVPAPQLLVPPTAPVVEAAPVKPVFALASEISARLKTDKSEANKADRDAATKVYETRLGAPIWVTETGLTDRALAVMTEIRAADGFGLQASAFKLPAQALADAKVPTATELADAEVTLSLAALKYARHARGGRLDPAALSEMFDRKPQVFAPASVLSELAVAAKPGAYLRLLHPTHPQFEKLRLKYLAAKSGQDLLPPPPLPAPEPPVVAGKAAPKKKAGPVPPTPAAVEKKILANMEMWRWMPEVGDTYVHNNIPEFMTRLYRSGKLVHAERIVTGKSDTQTPIFSDEFELVVFKPFWNVPESIKWKELQPELQRNPGALDKVGLKAAINGKEIDPRAVNWSTTDLRSFHVYQPPGAANALGQVKFLFPNKHDVYMHDTPSKSLFNNASRAYSHGCMRVRDPLKFAEMLLGPDKGFDAATIAKLANSGPDNNEIRLNKKLPIHITYFTTWVDDDGQLKVFNDIYGHEQKVHLGLDGKAHLIVQAKAEQEKAPPRRNTVTYREAASSWSSKSSGSSPFESWAKSIFNF
jgi:L,D-transpeptidase YcbB